MSVHIYGIRHHGPGSARSLRQALEELQPDCILVEGPPDAAEILPLLIHREMRPPVALLLYSPEEPQRAAFYPFAIFSPEWQALDYGLSRKLAVQFMDLPQTHRMALDQERSVLSPDPEIHHDPIGMIAEAAGHSDGERWWEQMVEQRCDSTDLFAAVREMMAALRESAGDALDRVEALREAWMRRTIRSAQRDGFERIAVVCGAWHAPALEQDGSAKEDEALLKGLPKRKIAATWTPWTYGRLSLSSGYGAGIESPGWYQHLWESPDDPSIRWMTRVARLLREEDLDASAASVIEAVRLAESVAALRGRSNPGLEELNEAVRSVLCFGNDLPLQVIHTRLIVGEILGKTPDEAPLTPLQQDLRREQKRLRLQPEALDRTLDLDLRKEKDLQRSRLLHRLGLLGLQWGELQRATGKGTFHEIWRLQWRPEFEVDLIDASRWGNTIPDASVGRAVDQASKATDLSALSALLERSLLADLPAAVSNIMTRLQHLAALTSDIAQLMDTLPPLAETMRYGNVRRTDADAVGEVIAGLITRICIGLPLECASLNDDAAIEMFGRVIKTNTAISVLQNESHINEWRAALRRLADQRGLHGLIAGRASRLLVDAGVLTGDEAATRLSLALSAANEPSQAAAWIEGFLKDSGLLLLHDEALWRVIDEWLVGLQAAVFTSTLPLLRRTFSTFSAPERRQMGERVRKGSNSGSQGIDRTRSQGDFDHERAATALPLVAQLLGLEAKS
jgi:hypothetical protein